MVPLAPLADLIRRGAPADALFAALERVLAETFGHRLFTVLVFDAQRDRLIRIHSSRPDINPVGGAKAVTPSVWTQHVLKDARLFVGSNRDDIKAVFSDYQLLWSIGCESVLNIPVRQDGIVVGTLNLLDRAGQYDACDHDVALNFAALMAPTLATCLAAARRADLDETRLEHV
jgi:hypothetical protein